MGKKKTQRTITKIQKNHCGYTCSSAQETCIAAAAWCQVGKSWPNDLSQRLVLLAQIMPTTHQNIFATGIHPFVIFICFIHYKHESDRIRMESDSDSTFYHILTRMRIHIRMLSDTMQNGCLEFRYRFGYLLDLEHSYIRLFYSL